MLRTGFSTQQGSLLRTMAYASKETSVNSRDTFFFIALLLCFAAAAATVVVREGLRDEDRNRFKLMLHTIIICTSVVPPELPMELSLAVTNSLKSLVGKRVYCTEPFRIPLGGKVEWCAFDKTGTLTSDEMECLGVASSDGSQTGQQLQADLTGQEVGADTTGVLVACQALAVQKDGEVIGDPLERAVLKATGWKLKSNNVVQRREDTILVLRRCGFDSKLKRMCVVAGWNGRKVVYGKGAPEIMKDFFISTPESYETTYKFHMSKGRRVLALGHKELPDTTGMQELNSSTRESLESGLTFCGLVVLACPIKDGTKEVISELQDSGHTCVMITGDASLTATEVARKVGIVRVERGRTLELRGKEGGGFKWVQEGGKEFDWVQGDSKGLKDLKSSGYELCVSGDALGALVGEKAGSGKGAMLTSQSLKTLGNIVPHVSVFARHAPRQKEAVIASLNSLGKFTMMCGDGTNDVGALKQAHVGISLISVPEVERKKRKAMECMEIAAKVEKLKRRIDKAKSKGDEGKVSELEGKLRKAERKAKGKGGLRDQMKALKDAEDEVMYVGLGDASVAAPFTYR